jgi:hypothetical protein
VLPNRQVFLPDPVEKNIGAAFAPPLCCPLVTHKIIIILIYFSFMCLVSFCPLADQIMPEFARTTEEGEQPALTATP